MDLALQQLQQICPQTPSARLAEVLPSLAASLLLADVHDAPERAAVYIGQIAHETMGFQRLEENLNYSAAGIFNTWPHRFKTVDDATPYARNPEKLGNSVYADRMGNGDEASGDGFRYRGRGGLMITGCDAYRSAGHFLSLELVTHPELAADLEHAFRVAAWVWRSKGCSSVADNLLEVTRRINGGFIGLQERELVVDRAYQALGVAPMPA